MKYIIGRSDLDTLANEIKTQVLNFFDTSLLDEEQWVDLEDNVSEAVDDCVFTLYAIQ